MPSTADPPRSVRTAAEIAQARRGAVDRHGDPGHGRTGVQAQLQEDTMGLRLTQDVSATHAYRSLSVTQDQVSRSMERLSSRLGIDPSSHDAARPDLAHQV